MKGDKEHIKKLILTDYLDNRLEDNFKEELERMIAEDEELSAFLRKARRDTLDPFSRHALFQAPERVWATVEERLDVLAQRGEPRFWTRWLAGWPQSRLIWAEISFALVLGMIVTVTQVGRQPVARYDKDSQVEYLMLLTQAPAGAGASAGESKTNIEKYFL